MICHSPVSYLKNDVFVIFISLHYCTNNSESKKEPKNRLYSDVRHAKVLAGRLRKVDRVWERQIIGQVGRCRIKDRKCHWQPVSDMWQVGRKKDREIETQRMVQYYRQTDRQSDGQENDRQEERLTGWQWDWQEVSENKNNDRQKNIVSDSYPAFFLLIATTSNKKI